MADVIKSQSTLQLVAEFADGDDRTISLTNPRVDVTADEINSVSNFIKTNDLLLGDKEQADFSRIKKAQKVSQVTRYLDLG